MRAFFGLLAFLTSIYSILIFIRIILTWFSAMVPGKPVLILSIITDPYLNWWRKNLNLRAGFLDFSVIVAIVFLSLIQNVFYTLSLSEKISLGFLLAQILISLWTIVSFIIGFFLIIIILRGIAYIFSLNTYTPFWSIVESISQPVMYRINRLIYGKNIGNYFFGIVVSFFLFLTLFIGGRFIINILANILYELPI
jgi:YggT family protein